MKTELCLRVKLVGALVAGMLMLNVGYGALPKIYVIDEYHKVGYNELVDVIQTTNTAAKPLSSVERRLISIVSMTYILKQAVTLPKETNEIIVMMHGQVDANGEANIPEMNRQVEGLTKVISDVIKQHKNKQTIDVELRICGGSIVPTSDVSVVKVGGGKPKPVTNGQSMAEKISENIQKFLANINSDVTVVLKSTAFDVITGTDSNGLVTLGTYNFRKYGEMYPHPYEKILPLISLPELSDYLMNRYADGEHKNEMLTVLRGAVAGQAALKKPDSLVWKAMTASTNTVVGTHISKLIGKVWEWNGDQIEKMIEAQNKCMGCVLDELMIMMKNANGKDANSIAEYHIKTMNDMHYAKIKGMEAWNKIHGQHVERVITIDPKYVDNGGWDEYTIAKDNIKRRLVKKPNRYTWNAPVEKHYVEPKKQYSEIEEQVNYNKALNEVLQLHAEGKTFQKPYRKVNGGKLSDILQMNREDNKANTKLKKEQDQR